MKKLSLLAAALCASVSFNLRAEVVEISSATELYAAIAANPSGDYKLTADIDCSTWTSRDFSGTLDGDGKTISGLTTALFGTVSGNATIKNLVISNAEITHTDAKGTTISGFVASVIDGSDILISDIVFSSCSLQEAGTAARAGMVAGKFRSVSSARVQNIVLEQSCSLVAANACGGLGGVIGSLTADGVGATVTLSNCVNRGSLSITGYTTYLAGIVASAACTSTGTTSADLAHVVFEDCVNYSSVNVNKTNPSFSPIVNSVSSDQKNYGDFTFIRCVNYGDVTINAYNQLGGILGGSNNGSPVHMRDCVNYGNLTCTSAKQVGGLVGNLAYILNTENSFVGCANCGNLSGQIVGGFVGQISANTSFKSSAWRFVSCLQRGAITATGGDMITGEFVGKFYTAFAYQNVEFAGSLVQCDKPYGLIAAGGSLKDPVIEGNLVGPDSEGLVDGSDVETLNAFRDCGLWKQGSTGPILKCMSDEPDPDVITVNFKDAADFDSAVLKTCVILRGGMPVAPTAPEHDGYTFLNWDPEDFSALQEDIDIVAVYQQGTLEHKVRFFDWDGTQIGEDQLVEHGKPAVAPNNPSREGYLFTGWDADFSAIVEDLDVTAEYVLLVQEVMTADDLVSALTNAVYREVTYRLKNDVELPADWKSVDFVSTLDGAGHVLRYLGGKPLFSKLTGGICNVIIDGETDGGPTVVKNINERFGLVAVECVGGTVSSVTLRNYQLEVANTASGHAIAFFCGVAGEGTLIEGCTVDGSCAFKTRSCTSAGFVASTVMSDNWPATDPRLLTIVSCTNNADIVSWTSGACNIAGILADCSSADAVRRPVVVISNCVNNGSISTTYATGIEGRFGGIVAYRYANIDSGVLAGSLTIADCVNNGNIDLMGGGLNGQGATACFYAGILAYNYRFGSVDIIRCKNTGRIGGMPADATFTVIDGCSGGIAGYLTDTYGKRPILISDSANYGAVIGGTSAGGQIGYASANSDYRNIYMTSTNCANYGEVSVIVDGGYAGEWIGNLNTNPKQSVAPDCVYGAWNSFFRTENLIGHTGGAVATFDNCKTAADDGYTASAAKKSLNAWATANGYEQWVVGSVGGVDYPELGIFCINPLSSAGLMLLFR